MRMHHPAKLFHVPLTLKLAHPFRSGLAQIVYKLQKKACILDIFVHEVTKW